ncbi:hypothetical protein BK666_02160 [Pseudomonas frederiksbergensis]|uniref:Uncharacterized protein n=1 Tax=Pseudomonas frederiksbergensis TaxID=104087 RepID=A0A423KID2_9PSED|nr:hypothetical protein [Pseudomonas frederiksbergensis]RON52922.1 hypothetical protein BK666_02160 [Pseudomonas frederiksbergensis]
MAAPSAAAASIVEAVVANGRTVIGVDGKKKGPGQTVKLPAAEVASLMALGFLVDGDAIIKKQPGPHVSVAAGPTVRLA